MSHATPTRPSRSFTLGAIAAAVLAAATGAQAQSWPAKPIRVIEPAVAGSAVDTGMRSIAPKLSESLGQPVVIENRPGANSAIGAREAARAAPDGYTVFHGNINNAFNDLLSNDPCCRLNQELVSVTRVFSTPMVFVVHPSVPANTLREYLDLAKGKPKGVTYASGGTGSLTQMVGEMIRSAASVDIAEIPYKSIGAEVPDLLAGHVMTGFLSPSSVVQSIRAGRLKALALADKSRLAILPNVPTMTEAGLPMEATGWNGLYVPAGTPEPIIRRLQQEAAKAMTAPDVRANATENGWVLGGEPSDVFAAYMRSELVKWGKVIKDANIKLQ